MNTLLKQKVDLMIENYHQLKGPFKWETHLTRHFSAMVHALRQKNVDIERLEEIKRYIKDETSWTSCFRGINIFILTSLLSFEEDYKAFFQAMERVYEKLRAEGFKKSDYLPLCAYTIVKEVPEGQWDFKIMRIKAFFAKMKENHFWITSHNDYVFAAILGISDLELEETTEKIESCYRDLNEEGFWKGNDLQTLSHILALGEEETERKCKKAYELYHSLKEVNCKLQYSGLATLGVLTLVNSEVNGILRDVKEVYDYIYEKEGYGPWKLDKSVRTILAATLVSDIYVDEAVKGVQNAVLGNSISSILIAEQQAAIVAMCAASSAAAASSAST